MEQRDKVTSGGAVMTALFSAPCFISLMLLPLGASAFMSTALYIFLDKYRLILMAVALISLGFTHWALRKGSHFHPTKTVWVITIIVLVFVIGELVVDPPWHRHLLVPM